MGCRNRTWISERHFPVLANELRPSYFPGSRQVFGVLFTGKKSALIHSDFSMTPRHSVSASGLLFKRYSRGRGNKWSPLIASRLPYRSGPILVRSPFRRVLSSRRAGLMLRNHPHHFSIGTRISTGIGCGGLMSASMTARQNGCLYTHM